MKGEGRRKKGEGGAGIGRRMAPAFAGGVEENSRWSSASGPTVSHRENRGGAKTTGSDHGNGRISAGMQACESAHHHVEIPPRAPHGASLRRRRRGKIE